MITWAEYPDGSIRIWRDGEFIGEIPADRIPALMLSGARALQNAR